MRFQPNVVKIPRQGIPPAVFGLTFFLMLSSCASLMPSQNRDVWEDSENTESVQPEEYQVEAEPPPETGVDLIPGTQQQLPRDLVSGLPKAPRYKTGEAGRHRSTEQKKTKLDSPFKSPEVNAKQIPLPDRFLDDMDTPSMKEAIRNHMAALEEMDLEETVRLGDHTITRQHLKATLLAFDRLLDRNLPQDEFDREIRRNFDIIPAGLGMHKRMLFTGYYTPVIPASTEWSPEFPYPLYRKPEAHEAEVSDFEKALKTHRDYGFHLIATTRPIALTREAIDGRAVLKDKNLEVAWLQDDLERYFLHIQGSGYLRFPDGRLQAVQYMGSNDMPYASVGKKLIRDGIITTSQGSMQGIKAYFRDHPEDISKYLYSNPRYIFFNQSNSRPRGSTGAELVPGRAIATDKKRYPGGGLVFISARKPVLDQSNHIQSWEPFSRFVLDQDTGSAIRGLGRADLYFGVGEQAGAQAGHYMERGKAFYLLLKGNQPAPPLLATMH